MRMEKSRNGCMNIAMIGIDRALSYVLKNKKK